MVINKRGSTKCKLLDDCEGNLEIAGALENTKHASHVNFISYFRENLITVGPTCSGLGVGMLISYLTEKKMTTLREHN